MTLSRLHPCDNGAGNARKNSNTKFTKKHSRSFCELRENTDLNLFLVTGANDPQQPILDFLTG